MNDLPQWYLDESRPRLKRLDELSPIAYPDQPPRDSAGVLAMYLAKQEWDRLMRAQCDAEESLGL